MIIIAASIALFQEAQWRQACQSWELECCLSNNVIIGGGGGLYLADFSKHIRKHFSCLCEVGKLLLIFLDCFDEFWHGGIELFDDAYHIDGFHDFGISLVVFDAPRGGGRTLGLASGAR